MPPRVVVINHRRNLGSFRATATTRDHANGEPCGCGGTCCEDKKKLGLRDRYQQRDNQLLSSKYQGYSIYKMDNGKFWVWYGKTDLGKYNSKGEAEVAIRKHQDLRAKDSKDTRCDMAIDAKYAQGDKSETRHFVIPDNLVDPRGSPPQGTYVLAKLRENADHRAMIRNGWRLEDVEGYYKPV